MIRLATLTVSLGDPDVWVIRAEGLHIVNPATHTKTERAVINSSQRSGNHQQSAKIMTRLNPYFDSSKFHHTRRGFRNPAGSPPARRLTAETAREVTHFMGEMRHLIHDPSPFGPEHVLAEADALQSYQQMDNPHRLTWLGHASFMVTLSNKRILTDPYLSPHAAPLPLPGTKRMIPSAITVEKLPAVDVIVISHNHYDHLDTSSLKTLALAHSRAHIVVPLGLKNKLKAFGFRCITELDWYESVTIAGLTIDALPAIHTSKRGLWDTNRSLWCGFRLADQHRSVYFAGDTAYGQVFCEIGQRYPTFDLGLVPIGAYQPRSLMRSVHCTPEEAVQIGRDIGARHLVGMHWGTIRLSMEPMLEPRDRFLAAADDLSRQVMRIGETIPF